MIKFKYMLMLTLLNVGFLSATTLQTSDDLNNLEIVTDSDCEKKYTGSQTVQPEVPVTPKTQEVETVNYTLSGCNDSSSFPVTVRSHKRQGE